MIPKHQQTKLCKIARNPIPNLPIPFIKHMGKMDWSTASTANCVYRSMFMQEMMY